MTLDGWLQLYGAMALARALEQAEADLAKRGEVFFFIASAGHESTAALAPHLGPADWLMLHYRDRALALLRGITPEASVNAVLCKDGPPTWARRLNCMVSAAELNLLSVPTPVGNGSPHCVGVAAAIKDQPERPIVYCGLGEGATQEGEILESIGEAARERLPVLFCVQDNGLAISTRTAGKTIVSLPGGEADQCLGAPITHADGRDPLALDETLSRVIGRMRETRGPEILHLRLDRLDNHTSSDDQRAYRTEAEIAAATERGDPIQNLRRGLMEKGVPKETLDRLDAEARERARAAIEAGRRAAEPTSQPPAKAPLPAECNKERPGDDDGPRLTMLEAIKEVLRHQLATDPAVTLHGQDIEDPKGDVFGVTRGLSTDFPGRVMNAPLAEAMMVGKGIGRALAGERPVVFLQFADFLPLAFNQLHNEAATLHWRSDGTWRVPLVVMVPCGGYRPGVGPFHSQTLEAVLAHAAGLDVVMPSTAGDAAGLLNAVFASGRPTVFLYPKSLLNDRENTTSADVAKQRAALGKARVLRAGHDLTLVGWGHTMRLCREAAERLADAGVEVEVIDLRSISPWDEAGVLASAEKTGRLLVVHEDNRTCGLGGEIVATMAERASRPVACKRVTRADTFVPCHFETQLHVLPSLRAVVEAAAGMVGMTVAFEEIEEDAPGSCTVRAVGSSPSDESVTVVDLLVKVGDEVREGAVLASVEADKAGAEVSAPRAGSVAEILVAEGETVKVGTPLLRLATDTEPGVRKPMTEERLGPATFTRAAKPGTTPAKAVADAAAGGASAEGERPVLPVGLSAVSTAIGTRVVTAEETARRFDDTDAAGIVRRCGIRARLEAGEGQTVLGLAVDAAKETLRAEGLTLADIDLIICSTGTPIYSTPSLACLVLYELEKAAGGQSQLQIPAYDISAACSGYLYGLQQGWDWLQTDPAARILLITAEVLSPKVDPQDFATAILFGDAATATVLYGAKHLQRARALCRRPEVSGRGDDGHALRVPLHPATGEYIYMSGTKVFTTAVRSMAFMLTRACTAAGVEMADLDLIIPHQANQRIIDAIRNRGNLPVEKVYSNISSVGNTSSSSIPLCLAEVLPQRKTGERIGLAAFGGGFTYGAALLQMR